MEVQAGEPEKALAALQEGDELLAAIGDHNFRSTTQADLALVHASLGDTDAASQAIELAEQLGDPNDAITHSKTHAARARLALAAGDASAAERWARGAVEQASRMDTPIPQGDAELELAQVLNARGNTREAIASTRRALKLFTAKGDQPRACQAQSLLKDLSRQ
jgi:tetratricopeptide (TPR) repeat protein